MMVEHGEKAGSSCPSAYRYGSTTSGRSGSGPTPWRPNKDEAIEITDEEIYHRYMKYLTGAQYYFIEESIDVNLVTYLKPGAA